MLILTKTRMTKVNPCWSENGRDLRCLYQSRGGIHQEIGQHLEIGMILLDVVCLMPVLKEASKKLLLLYLLVMLGCLFLLVVARVCRHRRLSQFLLHHHQHHLPVHGRRIDQADELLVSIAPLICP